MIAPSRPPSASSAESPGQGSDYGPDHGARRGPDQSFLGSATKEARARAARAAHRRMDARALRAELYRRALFGAGVVFLAIGCIGMVVPMMPGTVFLILAAWCFTRSSPRIEAWLLNHRYLGPSVRRWQETGAIPLVAKGFALTSFVGSFGGAWYFGAPDPVLIFLGGLFALLTAFIVTRPN